jgi:predicted phage gp36 major capsid-like protein
MENSKNLRSALETEKTGIFEQVRKDLEEIRDSFESRLKALLAESTAKVSNIAAETEKEITDVYKRCDDEIKHDGTASKAQIDKSIAEFVRLLAEHRANALDLIAKSAGSVGDSASVTPPSPIQPPPTNFDFPDDLDF